MCKQHHWTTFNPFLDSTKNGDVDGTCKRSFILCESAVLQLYKIVAVVKVPREQALS